MTLISVILQYYMANFGYWVKKVYQSDSLWCFGDAFGEGGSLRNWHLADYCFQISPIPMKREYLFSFPLLRAIWSIFIFMLMQECCSQALAIILVSRLTMTGSVYKHHELLPLSEGILSSISTCIIDDICRVDHPRRCNERWPAYLCQASLVEPWNDKLVLL